MRVHSALQLIAVAAIVASQGLPEDLSSTAVTIVTESREGNTQNSTEKQPEVIQRCRADELSPGGALSIMVVLATGSAVHMPGSLLVPQRGRFAPELGILEVALVLLMVSKGIFVYGQSLRTSVTATLALRYFRSDGDAFWWRQIDTTTTVAAERATAAAQCYDCARPFLNRIQRIGNERLLGNGLVLLTLIKAFATHGTIRTNLLAASYALSYITLELLSLAALRIGRPPTREECEKEALKMTELITQLDKSEDSYKHRTVLRWQAKDEDSLRHKALQAAVVVLFGLPAVLHLIFWPFSVPLFLFYEFHEWHSKNGKWIYSYLVSGYYLLLIAVVVSVVLVVALATAWIMDLLTRGNREEKYVATLEKFLTSRYDDHQDEWLFDMYTAVKFGTILRHYAWFYTGQGTSKPEWLEWFG